MSSELELKHVSANGIRFAYHEAGAGNGPLVLQLRRGTATIVLPLR